MAVDAHKNLAASTVATAPSPATTGTSLVVATGDGTKFPTPPFNATVWPAGAQATAANSEIVRVTAIATDTLTITRTAELLAGQGSPSPRTIVVGDQIAATQTVKTFTDIEAAIAAVTAARQNASLIVIGHSYASGSGTNSPYKDGMISRLQAMLGVHDDNVTNFAQGSAFLSGTTNPLTGDLFGGWAAALQFLWPENAAQINSIDDAVITDPLLPVSDTLIVVHGINDLSRINVNFTDVSDARRDQNVAYNQAAYINALRGILSRHRAGVVYGSTTDTGTNIAWSNTIAFGGTWADVASTQMNSGPAYKQTTTVTDWVRITIPTQFRGGTVAIAFIGQTQISALLTTGMTASSANTDLWLDSDADVPAMPFVVTVDSEDMLVTAKVTTNHYTVTRAVNGTSLAAHTVNVAAVFINPTACRVDWSGTAAGATGSTYLSGQGLPRGSAEQPCLVVKRFALTAADATKTLIATLAASDASVNSAVRLRFDSWWIESPTPAPSIIANIPDYAYGGFASTTHLREYISAWNAAVRSLLAEFTDGFSVEADAYTPWHNRNGTVTGGAGTATGVTHTTITDSGASFTAQAVGAIVTMGGRTLTVTSQTATQLTGSAGWQGGADPAAGAYTISLNGTDASTVVKFTANDSSFTPAVGQVMYFGYSGEQARISAVSGSAPNWTLTLTRPVNGSTEAAHAAGDWMGPADWMYSDFIHPNVLGHAVFATILNNAIASVPTPLTPYQVASSQGLWTLNARNPLRLNVPDNGYVSLGTVPVVGTGAAGLNVLTAAPIFIPRAALLVGVGVEITAANTGTIRFGIWLPSNIINALPGKLLKELGSVSNGSTGIIGVGSGFSGGGNVFHVLRPGWYFLGCVQQGGTGSGATLRTLFQYGNPFIPMQSTDTPLATSGTDVVGFSQTGVSGALADFTSTPTSITGSTTMPRIIIRLRGANQY